ncbi:hypothetical protein NMY22_g17908 [Coprinellus aureogranulatus]|nr:hypothetical protein NMY22_g17908 [Coprinellus aureogranulatus]
MSDRKGDRELIPTLPVFESQPPAWLPQIHSAGDLGYPGFHPTRPGQDEDKMSTTNVKNGYALPLVVDVETYTANGFLNDKLRDGDALAKFEDLINEVFHAKSSQLPPIPPSSFRIPPRVTLNEGKRQSWFSDLANPDVPLNKLGKSVPHGAKGHDLLDQLHDNNVAINRAVWVLRVHGANETAGIRNKPTYDPTQYSMEWANVFTGYLKKQLDVIMLPIAPRPGLTYKHTFKGVLSDTEPRERWVSRFSYCLKLLRAFYHEGMVDSRVFLVWMVQQIKACNLAQAGFLTRLVDEYLDDLLKCLPLAKLLVEAMVNKLSEIMTTATPDTLVSTRALIKVILQRLFLAIPDAYISPRLWRQHYTLLESALSDDMVQRGSSNDRHLEQNLRELSASTMRTLFDIRHRIEALAFREPPARVSAKLIQPTEAYKLLNSITSDTDLSSIGLFEQHDREPMSFSEKLDMLLTWSVTPLQYGDHRPLAAVTLVRSWRDKACERANRRRQQDPHDYLQDQLFDWLDNSEIAGDPGNIRPIALLYGKLVKYDLFSYPNYIQRLIARGESGLACGESPASRHHHFLKWIPLFNTTPSLMYQRKVTLHGVRARETPEDIVEKEIRKEMRAVLPYLFGGPSELTIWKSTSALLNECKSFVTATRYEQVRTFRQWLIPAFEGGVAKAKTDAQKSGIVKAYRVIVELMDYAKCFASILELTLCLLKFSRDSDSLACVVDILHHYAAIWPCMNATPSIVEALHGTYQIWKARGLQSRPLLGALMEFDNGRHLAESSRNEIMADIAAFRTALQPIGDHADTIPKFLPEVLELSMATDPDAPGTLADGLWIKYRMSSNWASRVWSNILASFQQRRQSSPHEIAIRYGMLLWRVDQHLPNGLDKCILQWFEASGPVELPALEPDTWVTLEDVLVYLAVQGALKTTTILSGLVYPAWQLASRVEAPGPSQLAYFNAAKNLCKRLLLEDDAEGSRVTQDLFDMQQLRTRRQAVFQEPHFSTLVGNIPLIIYLENLDKLPEEHRTSLSCLRRHLCQGPGFRQGTGYDNLRKEAMSGLRLILWDSPDDIGNDDWPEVSSLLSPWKLAATTIQMQFQIKQVGRALSQANTHEVASNNLDKLTLMLFHHTKTAEEALYVGEMTRGAEPAVSMKFVKTGLTCIKNLLQGVQVDAPHFTKTLNRVGELLRILIHVTAPFRENGIPFHPLDPAIHEQFLETLSSKMTSLVTLITSPDLTDAYRSNLILLARLVQFIFNFRESAFSSALRDICHRIVNSLFQLALHYGSGDHIDATLYPLLMDTLIFVCDEIPLEAKSPTVDPFHYYPDMPISSLPTSMPQEYREQILTLLTRNPSTSVVTDLVYSYRDSQGNVVSNGPVVNRPWEWAEHLGDPSPEDEDERSRFQAKHLVKNSGSISLEVFGARLTGDSIVRNLVSREDPRMEDNLRTFEDGLSSESVFARDWRETRVVTDLKPVTEHIQRMRIEGGEEVTRPLYGTGERSNQGTPRGSPAPSMMSRSSGRASTRRYQSPSQGSTTHHRMSNSTMGDPMDLDNIPNVASRRMSGSSKRKPADDDEVEIVEAHVSGKRARTSTTATTAKTRGNLRKK